MIVGKAEATLGTAIADAARYLASVGVRGARADARLLMSHATGLSRDAILSDRDLPLHGIRAITFAGLVERRAAREPIAYIVGAREFFGLEFLVRPGVLVPRPDSETLIEAVLDLFPELDTPLRVLDLGVGSGCLLLTVMQLYEHASGVGVDCSDHALACARLNADRLGLAQRTRIAAGDWGHGLSGPFDLILSNPPYIESAIIRHLEPEVRDHEPGLALDGGSDGLDAYRVIAPCAAHLLRPGGSLVVEVGAGQSEAVARLFADVGLTPGESRRDLGGIERCVVAHRSTVTGKA